MGRLKPYLTDPDFSLYCGDVCGVLGELAEESVDAIVTSPPYGDARPDVVSIPPDDFADWISPVLTDLARVFACPVGEAGNPHPSPMALDLAVHLVALSCKPGGTVLDPFCGSGTTALAARLLGRKSIGIEVSPDYCEMAAVRLSQLSLLGAA